MTTLRLFRSATESTDTDAELLARFVTSRDESAFGELLRRHGPIVHRVCQRTLDESRADDAFQATFLVLATRAHQVRKAASLGSWLIGVAGRVARQMRRKCLVAGRARLLPSRLSIVDTLSDEHRLGGSLSLPTVETADLGRVLDEELTRLPDKLRDVVVACLIEERTQVDAAMVLGESERTVRRRVTEARQLLRERLERRGVVPIVVGGLLASLGTATAVPFPLTTRTISVVFDFLAGGAAVASVPASLAKGVAMSGFRMKVAATVSVFALGLSALSVGLADDKPKAAEPTIPPTKVAPSAKPPVKPLNPLAEAPARFVVTGGDVLVNRVIQREAEYQARALALKWTGKPLPPLKDKWQITVEISAYTGKNHGWTTFNFNDDKSQPTLVSASMGLQGTLEEVLRVNLPHELTRCVFTAHFGWPLPRWAYEGIAMLGDPGKLQVSYDARCREDCVAGRCVVLRKLLQMDNYPTYGAEYFQAHSVARFLHDRDPKKLLPLIEARFADGWDKALKAIYGFKDADALEEAWLAWLKKPESVLKAESKPVKSSWPKYVVEPPDVLLLKFKPKPVGMPESDEHRVRPDGTITLGKYGSVFVSGFDCETVADKVRRTLQKQGHDVSVTADVLAYNSKSYWVITDSGGSGQQVVELPITGKETVLSAIAKIGGLRDGASKPSIQLARKAKDSDEIQYLSVDWRGITEFGNPKTDFQLLPGDRLYIKTQK